MEPLLVDSSSSSPFVEVKGAPGVALLHHMPLFSGMLWGVGQLPSQRAGSSSSSGGARRRRVLGAWAALRVVYCLVHMLEAPINALFILFSLATRNYIGYSSCLLWITSLCWAVTAGGTTHRLVELLTPENCGRVHEGTRAAVAATLALSLLSIAGQWFLYLTDATVGGMPVWFAVPWLVNSALALLSFAAYFSTFLVLLAAHAADARALGTRIGALGGELGAIVPRARDAADCIIRDVTVTVPMPGLAASSGGGRTSLQGAAAAAPGGLSTVDANAALRGALTRVTELRRALRVTVSEMEVVFLCTVCGLLVEVTALLVSALSSSGPQAIISFAWAAISIALLVVLLYFMAAVTAAQGKLVKQIAVIASVGAVPVDHENSRCVRGGGCVTMHARHMPLCAHIVECSSS